MNWVESLFTTINHSIQVSKRPREESLDFQIQGKKHHIWNEMSEASHLVTPEWWKADLPLTVQAIKNKEMHNIPVSQTQILCTLSVRNGSSVGTGMGPPL